MRILLTISTLATLAAAPLLAQDQTTADDAPANGEETAAPATDTPAEPEWNGTASGTVSGVSFNVPVVCAGFPEGPATAQSDPNTPGEDGNGDGVLVDVTAQTTGDITMSLMAGGIAFGFDDDTATIEGNQLDYSVTISFVGGTDDTIEYSVVCDG